MNRRIWIGLGIIIAIILVVMLVARDTAEPTGNSNGINGGDTTEETEVGAQTERVLNELPRQFTTLGRTALLDRQAISANSRSEFSFREATTLPQQDEDPADYIERIMRIRLGRAEVQDQPEFYEYAASFYLMDGGIVAFVNVDNIPDDSVGQTEERFEFAYTDGEWPLTWYGERSFCRRPAPGSWQPADELCP